MRQLEEVVQQNVSASVELAATAASLTAQATTLEHLVGFFRVDHSRQRAGPPAAFRPGQAGAPGDAPTPRRAGLARCARRPPGPLRIRPSIAGPRAGSWSTWTRMRISSGSESLPVGQPSPAGLHSRLDNRPNEVRGNHGRIRRPDHR